MDERFVMVLLRLIHIVGGVFWVGTTLAMTFFFVPALRTAGPEGGRFMQEVMRTRKLQTWVAIAMGLTILSGLVMYGGAIAMSSEWARSRFAMTLGVGAAASILAAILGMALGRPTGMRLMAIGQQIAAAGGPPSAEQRAEMEKLQRRVGTVTLTVAILLLIAAVTMAIARYV